VDGSRTEVEFPSRRWDDRQVRRFLALLATILLLSAGSCRRADSRPAPAFALDDANVVNEAFVAEAEVFTAAELAEGRRALVGLLGRLVPALGAADQRLPLDKRVALVTTLLEQNGYAIDREAKLQQQGRHLFLENLHSRALDCDTSAFVVLAAAETLGWPVSLRWIPGEHVVVHTGAGNVDLGQTAPDADYLAKLPPHLHKTFLSPMSRDEVRYLFHSNVIAYHLQQGELERALRVSERWRARETPGEGAGCMPPFERAVTLERMGRIDESIAAFNDCLSRCPDFPPALNNLGLVYLDLAEHERARSYLDRALAVAPELYGARINRAILRARTGDRAGAADDYVKAQALKKKYSAPWR
jgi:tetratricopeptide (TPR) repeat protein